MDETLTHETKPVLACIDGGNNGDRALRYAIQEGVRRDTGVRLLHVPLETIPHPTDSPVCGTPWRSSYSRSANATARLTSTSFSSA